MSQEGVRKIDADRPDLIVLVRHGESLRNRAKRGNIFVQDDEDARVIQGIPDHQIGLTDLGRRQAQATGVALQERFGWFDVVYDSDYRRTIETREQALKAFSPEAVGDMKLRRDSRLRERDSGYTYGMTTEEANRHFPWLQSYVDSFGYFYFRPPGGESQADVCDRVYRFNGTLFRHRAGKRVLIFAHGGTIRAMRFGLEGWNAERYEADARQGACANCGVTTYERDPNTNQLRLVDYNQVYWKE